MLFRICQAVGHYPRRFEIKLGAFPRGNCQVQPSLKTEVAIRDRGMGHDDLPFDLGNVPFNEMNLGVGQATHKHLRGIGAVDPAYVPGSVHTQRVDYRQPSGCGGYGHCNRLQCSQLGL